MNQRRYFNNNYFKVAEECRGVDLFAIWNDYVSEAKGRGAVNLLRKNYEVPLFEAPTKKSQSAINSFYQAKYSMFTCFDSISYIGTFDIDPALVAYWEPNIE